MAKRFENGFPAVRGQRSDGAGTAALRQSDGTQAAAARSGCGANAGVARRADGVASAAPHVELRDLAVGYGDRVVVDGIDLSIARGEIVTLVGPNGAGKSTILKTIARQLAAKGGRVLLAGRDIATVSAHELALQMSVVLTDRVAPELFTCHDVVAQGRYPYTGRFGVLARADEDAVDAALATVHASDLGERPFDSLSDGQRQRIMLARALAQEPDVIVLDEPTSFLDVRYKLDLLEILQDMAHRRGITVIMSLHEIDLALKVTDKIACVSEDRLSAFGAPDDVFDEQAIRTLYHLDNGSFDPLFGNLELPAPVGDPRVLVVSAGGSGIPVFRALQRRGVPFAAGILFDNDVDARLARLLAAETVVVPSFRPVPDEAFERACALVDACEAVLLCSLPCGDGNRRVQDVAAYATRAGKAVSADVWLHGEAR